MDRRKQQQEVGENRRLAKQDRRQKKRREGKETVVDGFALFPNGDYTNDTRKDDRRKS